MSWTYDASVTTDLARVRLLIGDTDDTDQLLQDEEIAYLLSSQGTVLGAAIAACHAIAGRYARQVQKSVGSMSLSAQQRFEHYRDLAATLQTQPSRSLGPGGKPYAGGISVADKDRLAGDADRTVPFFTRRTGEVGGGGSRGRWG